MLWTHGEDFPALTVLRKFYRRPPVPRLATQNRHKFAIPACDSAVPTINCGSYCLTKKYSL